MFSFFVNTSITLESFSTKVYVFWISIEFFLCLWWNFQIFLYTYNRFLHFHIIPADLLLITSFFKKSVMSIACSLMDSQKFFIQSLPLYISCLFSMFLNDDIEDIVKPDEICSLTFVVDEFSGLCLYPSMFYIKHSRSA